MPYRMNVTDRDPRVQDDILVEKLDEHNEWQVVITYNSMSDDYAFTNARYFVKRHNELESK